MKVLSLIFGLAVVMSCTSPEKKIRYMHEQFIQTIQSEDCDQIEYLLDRESDIMNSYLVICPFIPEKEDIFYPEHPNLQHIKLFGDSAQAEISEEYDVHFVNLNDQWHIGAPLWQVQLSAVTFLYALDLGYYDIAYTYSTKESNEVIKLMEQFEKLSGEENVKPQESELKIKIMDVQVFNDSAKVHYREANSPEEMVLIFEDKRWKADLKPPCLP